MKTKGKQHKLDYSNKNHFLTIKTKQDVRIKKQSSTDWYFG